MQRLNPLGERRNRGKTKKKRSTEIFEKPLLKMWLVNYQTMIRRYGGQRHPRLDSYDTLKDSGELVEWRYVPLDATSIYISHEWTGSSSPDHDGTQMYHLLRLLRRLREGEISRTDMDAFHSLFTNIIIQHQQRSGNVFSTPKRRLFGTTDFACRNRNETKDFVRYHHISRDVIL